MGEDWINSKRNKVLIEMVRRPFAKPWASSIQRLVEKPAKETEQAWWVTRENPERVMSWKARGGNGQLSGCWEAKPEWEREQRPLELAAWRLATGFAACGTFSSLTRWSLNHWTAREVPDNMVFNDLKKKQTGLLRYHSYATEIVPF